MTSSSGDIAAAAAPAAAAAAAGASAHAGDQPALAVFLLARYRYVVSAVDQIAISLLNFGLTFVLLRLLSTSDFGVVALWLAVANLAISIHAGFVGGPLGIHVPAEADEARRRRLGEGLASMNVLVVVVSMLIVLIVDGFSNAEWAPRDLMTAAAIPVFIGAGLFREYYRGIAFGRHDMVLLLVVDAPYVIVTTACLLAMLLWPHRLAGLAGAFIAMAAGAAAAQLCGFWQLCRQGRVRLLRRGWYRTYRGISSDVGWALIGIVFGHVQKRGYVYITTSLVGLAQLAALNAVGVFFRPAQILLTAWRRSALPEFAALVAAGQAETLARKLGAAVAIALAGCALWCAVLWIGWRLIVLHLLAGKYPEGVLLLLPWTIAIFLDTVDFVLATALMAAREFRFLAGVTMFTAPIAATAAAGLTMWHGYAWTIYGVAIGSAVSAGLATAQLARVRRRLLHAAAVTALEAPPSGICGCDGRLR